MLRAHLLLLIALALPRLVVADVGPIPGTIRVKPIFDKADLVCNGRIESIVRGSGGGSEGVVGSKDFYKVKVEVQDIYKKEPGLTGQIEIEYPHDPAVTDSGLRVGQTVLLFLIDNGSGAYELADRFLGLTMLDSLPIVSDEDGLGKLQSSLAGILENPDHDDQITALRLLQGFESLDDSTLATADKLASSNDPEVAFTALAVLLNTKTPQSVRKLKDFVGEYTGKVEPIALVSVGTELSNISNLKALPDLEALTNCRFVSIRYGAMAALRNIGSRESVPMLIQHLDDSNSNIQYSAVITLAEILDKRGDYGPNMEMFDKDPEKYIALWKQWWTDEGSISRKH